MHQGNVGLVLLAIALLHEEIVVVTPARFRESPASRRAIFVDRAPSLRRVKKLTRALEDMVLSMTKHTAVAFFHLCESLFGAFKGDPMTLCEAGNISTRDNDQVI